MTTLCLLGAFAELLRATVSFVLSDCPSLGTTCNMQHASRWTEFHIWAFFENPSRKFKFSENQTRITGTAHEDRQTLLIISRSVLLRMRNVSDEECAEHQNTRFVFHDDFIYLFIFTKLCYSWNNVEKLLYLYRARNKITQLSIPTHAQLQEWWCGSMLPHHHS